MKHIMEYKKWVISTTDPDYGQDDIEYDYISKNKLLYGIHEINVTYNGITIKARAKFDTGARSSSIDLLLAKKLGIDDELIESYKELERIIIPRNITKEEKEELEKRYTEEFTGKYPELSSIQISKSASGFSIRPYVRLNLEFNGRSISTEANLKDRSGMGAEMLVGLKDML